MKFIIKDWAGFHLFKHKTFETFDDGWHWLMEFFYANDLNPDEELQEYYITEVT